ncbi:hypothetical protein [Dyella nitratireducens]|uniref:DUF3352 domain-containing protein n=1 Tax=Dyella nitratireducens TaxID=1849580 RepID=A0ABQ1G2C1_9GAMM|nr:hypothetical protein [Dyella nitratireducens]GGA34700.1 hypothetical protein GCM10010981_24700 [Dyella nitratireducens]GLQ40905.1 hypothetical protein GCM10007902_07550 [Dyella nitratireducens]
MRRPKRVLALAFSGLLLAACSHKDKDAPLAFVPADTPYVLANLDVLDDETRQAILTQVDAELPAQVMQMKTQADQLADKDPDMAKYLRTVATEFDGKTAEQVIQETGVDPKGYMAFYGLGLSPVLRMQLADAKAFESFVTKIQNDYGKKFDVVTLGTQSYQRYVAPVSHLQFIIAIVGKQAVLALLPQDAAQPLLRQALGLDRPAKSVQDTDRLTDLAKSKGYAKWAVGEVDLTRLLPLFIGGQDPLAQALQKMRAENESSKTGEPVANIMQVPPSCQSEASRIAARMPNMSMGYTKLDEKHRDMRFDVSLASDIVSAFSGLKVELPGLGSDPAAPFELSLALPMPQLRAFWSAQAQAVSDKPFTCPMLDNLNDTFSSLGDSMQKAAVPPIGDLLGLHIALDSYTPNPNGGMPKVSGRVVIGTNNPAGLLAMAQVTSPMLNGLKLTGDNKPVALPAQLANALGESGWAAMGAKSLGIAVGAGEDGKLADTMQQPSGSAGDLMRTHLDGDMYANWIDLLEQRAEAAAATNATLNPDDSGAQSDPKAALASTKAQFEAMKSEAARIKAIGAGVRMEDQGLVITTHTELK